VEAAQTLLAIVVVMVGVPVVLLKVVDRLTLGAPTSKSSEESERELLEPDWDSVAKSFSAPAITSLRALYENEDLILKQEFEIGSPEESQFVATFLPVRIATIESYELPAQYFPFASDGTGNCYAFHWSKGEVWFWDHEGPEMHQVAGSLEEFLEG
jgi:hypothetical protein